MLSCIVLTLLMAVFSLTFILIIYILVIICFTPTAEEDLKLISNYFDNHAIFKAIFKAEMTRSHWFQSLNIKHCIFGFGIVDGTERDISRCQAWGIVMGIMNQTIN